MILSDRDILSYLSLGKISIDPHPLYNDIQPASVDLHLSNDFKDVNGNQLFTISLGNKCVKYVLFPKEFILASTEEFVSLNSEVVAKLDGKSSIGRKGILVHCTSGYVDPGWGGRLTLEIYNCSNYPFDLIYNMKICQIRFELLSSPSNRLYGDISLGSHYQSATTTEASKS